MAADRQRHLFVSYSRLDMDRVRPIVDAIREELDFRALPVDLWVDTNNLLPGEQWEVAIAEALRATVGFVFFLSPRSLQSEWVRREVTVAAASLQRLIIPIVLHRPLDDVPPALAERQWVDVSGRPTRKQIKVAAAQVAGVVESYLQKTPQPVSAVSKQELPKLAGDLAQEFRAATEPRPSGQHNSVFVVHGHNADSLAKLEEWLVMVGLTAVVLSRQDESPQSLFQKFMSVANKAQFAIVLLCADDYGASRIQYEAANVADKALQFRARQNVVLELGFFYGRLGWENVFVLYQEPGRVFPNFERPSDLDGVVFDSMTGAAWKRRLETRLSQAGFRLTLPNR